MMDIQTNRLFTELSRTGINGSKLLLPYTLGESSNLRKDVHFSHAWTEMIQDNTVSILGWIQYEKIKWLQTNNPEVPGLVYKLAPLDEKMRKLGNVRKLWEGVVELQPVRDVFNDDGFFPELSEEQSPSQMEAVFREVCVKSIYALWSDS